MSAFSTSAAGSAIVDAQIHMGPGGIAEALAAMDALGIGAALIDEYWLSEPLGRPCVPLANGAMRPVAPTAKLACQLHAGRFAYLLRVQRDDPGLAAVIGQCRDDPDCVALRIDPGLSPANVRAFAQGDYDALLGLACDAGMPVFVFCPDRPDAFDRAARAFPDLRIAIDHCGLFSNSMRATIGGGLPPRDAPAQRGLFDEVLALARHPNLALKWGHASGMFDEAAWPGEGLWPLLRQAVDAFSADRVMWASDYSVNQRGESWAELLFSVRGCPLLSDAERAMVLGGAARGWLGWDQIP